MTITQALSLDVARESVVRISAKQFDSNSRYLLITVLESGQEQAIPSASTITLNGRRPDGSSQSFLGEVQDGKAYLKIDDYLLEQYGTVYCSVSIIGSDGSRLSTLSFRMVVERAESTGWVLMYTAPSALSAGTYHINVGSISYQFTLTQALPVGGCIYFASDYTGAKTVVNGADVETLTLTVGTSGTELIGSDVINFLTQISAEVSSINEGLDSKADKSAIEENLAAGTSLATIDKDSYTPSTSPYLYRQSPSGKRCEYDVIGGTVGWNQVLSPASMSGTINGLTYSCSGGTVTVSGEATADTSIVTNSEAIKLYNHIYAILGFNGGSNTTWRVRLNVFGVTHANETITKITTASASGTGTNLQLQVFTSAGNVNISIKPHIIDLTTLLGSTIADYAYSLEQATAGSGIAWLKSFGFLSKGYYEYCEPTLKSVEATARKAVGINLFDKATMLVDGKFISDDNGNASTLYGASCTDFIDVLPNTSYYIKTDATAGKWGAWYDADKNFISGITGVGVKTAPTNARYIRFTINYTRSTGGDPNTFCINLSNPTINGTYYPYDGHTYPLGDVTLRGIPKLDSSNNIYYDGDRRKSDGTVTRRYGTRAYQSGDESLADAITDGTTTVYKLATPTTESTDSFTPIQYTGSTEEFSTENDVPVGVDAKYYTDLTLPKLPTANGTYTLKCTVTDGTGIVSWVSE